LSVAYSFYLNREYPGFGSPLNYKALYCKCFRKDKVFGKNTAAERG